MSGGTNQQKVTLPKFFETALQQQVGMAGDAAEAICSLLWARRSSFQPNARSVISKHRYDGKCVWYAYNGQGQQYMPEAQNYGGAMGYSSAPIYEGAVGEFQTRRPGQAQRIEGFTVDPVSGQPGQFAPSMQPVALEMTAAQKKRKIIWQAAQTQ